MKKNFALALAAIFALLLASAFADNDIEPADILYERTTIHANSNYETACVRRWTCLPFTPLWALPDRKERTHDTAASSARRH